MQISDEVRELAERPYQHGFVSEWRLQPDRHWVTIPVPTWQNARYAPIDCPGHPVLRSPEAEALASPDASATRDALSAR